MNALAELFADAAAALVEHGPTLFAGVTIVLAGGLLAMRVQPSVARRRTIGVLAAIGVALYLLCAVVPLPRLPWPQAWATAAESRAALRADSPSNLALLARLLADDPTRDVAATRRAAPPTTLPVVANANPVPPPAPIAAAVRWPWGLLLASFYLCGVLGLVLRRVVGQVRLWALLARCTRVPTSALHGIAVPRGVRVLQTERAVRPFCAGIVRPCVVLPTSLLAPERAAEAIAVLQHELAHLRARDPSLCFALAWLAVPLWCHPLFWWLQRDVRFCSEVLADDVAAAGGRTGYARALLDLAEHDVGHAAVAGSIAVFHRPSEFTRRVQMLLSPSRSSSVPASKLRRVLQALSMAGLVAIAGGTFGVPVTAQEPGRHKLQKQNDELRAQLDALRSELQALQAELRAAQDARVSGAGEEASNSLPGRSQLGRIRFREAAKVPGGEPVKVPLLSDLPLLGTMFRPGEPPAAGVPGMSGGAPAGEGPGVGHGQAHGVGHDAGHGVGHGVGHDDVLPGTPARGAADAPLPPSLADTASLVDLTSRFLDLQAELELQRVEVEASRRRHEQGLTSERESRTAVVRLAAVERKVTIARRLIEGEIAATEAELQWIGEQLPEAKPEQSLALRMRSQRARTRIQALQAVL